MTHDHWPPSQKWFDHYCITGVYLQSFEPQAGPSQVEIPSNILATVNTWSYKPSLAEVSFNSSWWTPWSRVYFLGYGMCRPCDISCWSRNVPWGAASWKTPGCDRQQIPPWQPSGGIVCKVCLLHFKLCKQSHLMVASFQSDGAGRQTCWRWPPHLWRQPCWGKTCMIFFGEHFYMG